ncbi:uncharacterized protein VTP21DRAFT_7846 [Calcarisporiella thermophila]|uniref:uncharacterized protein n=1 Tax=Calcarisporiella thermophila TaxID=911321 RepID=UPI003741FBBC
MDDLVELFQKVGLSEQKAKETAKNKKLAPNLRDAIAEAGFTETGCDKPKGVLLYTLASTITKEALPHLAYIARAIRDDRLQTADQVSAAIKFAAQSGPTIEDGSFDEACGVGVVVSPEDIKREIAAFVEANRETIVRDRYRVQMPLLGKLRSVPGLKWAPQADVREEWEKQFLVIVGPKDERDAPQKKKTEAKPKKEAAPVNEEEPNLANLFFEGELARMHKPGENKQIKASLMEEHLKATGGKVMTRFPPEPNGFLHIGHAKSININFGYARAHNGLCYLRYDDTNPEAEEERYFTSILETVRWLGFEPFKITYSSDYFQKLYELAVDLIRRDKAYICHCTPEEIHANRGGEERGPRRACVHRTRPISESLAEFEKMKEGRYKEGEAVLRMKMNLEDGNPQMWDLIAYRVKFAPHHRTGSDWCIYPTYDYTHCLCDSFENITHSLCTLEFRQSRESYYWLCDALEVYKPVQWEFGRLNVTNTVLSKRKVLKLVNEGYVDGWDDPRLFTLEALRRRGVPPEAINQFVLELGVTTSNTTIDVARLDWHTRNYLDKNAPRLMAVLEPIRITLENLPEDHLEELTVPNKPRDPSMGEHKVPFTRKLFIDASDFREEDSADYYRLAPGKTVGLLHVPHPITCTRVIKDDAGKIVELVCRYEMEATKKPKTYIQWVADSPTHGSPVALDEVRLYEIFFMHPNPQDKSAVPRGWLSDINPNSLHVIRGAIAEVGLWDLLRRWLDRTGGINPETFAFQMVRNGYFCLDKDTDLGLDNIKNGKPVSESVKKLVLNRTVTLKEDGGKDTANGKPRAGFEDPRKKKK